MEKLYLCKILIIKLIAYRNKKDKHNLKGISFIDIKNVGTRTSRGSISGLAIAPRRGKPEKPLDTDL